MLFGTLVCSLAKNLCSSTTIDKNVHQKTINSPALFPDFADPAFAFFFSSSFFRFCSDSACEVMHISLSRGNLLQSNMGGQGNPLLFMVPSHPALTFWQSDRQGYMGLSRHTGANKEHKNSLECSEQLDWIRGTQ